MGDLANVAFAIAFMVGWHSSDALRGCGVLMSR